MESNIPETDKYISGLTDYYREKLKNFQNTINPVKLLEIGVDKGGGLFFFSRNLFTNAQFFGIDIIEPETLPPNTIFENIHQRDEEKLRKFAEKYGPFDIVIDDASHRVRETKICLNIFWNHLNSFGWYFIEDWGVYKYQPTSLNEDFNKMASELLFYWYRSLEIIYNSPPKFSVIAIQK